MSSNPKESEATNAESAKNPREGSDWLGGPQNGDETPSESFSALFGVLPPLNSIRIT